MWFAALLLMILSLVPCGIALMSGSLVMRLPALQLSGVLSVLSIMLVAQLYQQPSFYDLALALLILSFPGAIVFIRFVERWL